LNKDRARHPNSFPPGTIMTTPAINLDAFAPLINLDAFAPFKRPGHPDTTKTCRRHHFA
jgi:hypothetical protein